MTNWEHNKLALEEDGAAMGDPRRCPRHPDQKTSSNDGMYDAPCGKCEHEIETGQSWEDYEKWLNEVHLPAMRVEARVAALWPVASDDDEVLF